MKTDDPEVAKVHQWLRKRGWQRYLNSWWFKPQPGSKNLPFGRELMGTARAFETERRAAIVG